MSAIVINLPYAAQNAPALVRKHLELPPEAWQLEHWRLIDPHLADIVRTAAAVEKNKGPERPVLVYPYSPLVADPWGLWASEFVSDAPEAEPEPAGAFLTHTTEGRPIAWSPRDREIILDRTVRPFHREIVRAAEERLVDAPMVLVLTVRSFNSRPWKFEKHKKYPRPQVTMGADPRWCPDGLVNLAGQVFRSFGWWPERNWPQKAAGLPPALAGRPRVKALTVSLCRGLYMDEHTGRPLPSAEPVARVLRTFFTLLDQELTRVVRLRLERLTPKPKPADQAPTVIKAPKAGLEK